jgi:hypothetical protein
MRTPPVCAEVPTDPSAGGVSVRFVDGVDGRFATLSVPHGIPVTVWRSCSAS